MMPSELNEMIKKSKDQIPDNQIGQALWAIANELRGIRKIIDNGVWVKK